MKIPGFDSVITQQQSKLRYLPIAICVSFIPAFFLSVLISIAAPGAKTMNFGDMTAPTLFFSVILAAPLIETLLMWPIIAGLKKITKGKLAIVAILSALVWAIVHSLFIPAWGFQVVWPFFIFSLCFLTWEKSSRMWSLVMTFLLHAGHNALGALIMYFFVIR